MLFSQVFFVNISMLITLAFLLNLIYKYSVEHFDWVQQLNEWHKRALLVLLMIFAGWLTMLFGLQIGESGRFDLRFLPLIISIFIFKHPGLLISVGVGIGLARFTFGVSEAAVVGFVNMTLLGMAAAALNYGFRRRQLSFFLRMTIAILTISSLNSVYLAVFGVIPFDIYTQQILPVTLPLGIVLSAFFIFILRDFYLEQRRSTQLRITNAILVEQKEELQRAKGELEEQAKQLTLASRYKSEFLANMSHELRTPLNSIILLAQLTHDQGEGRFTEEELQHLLLIRTSGEELLRQINDILDLSKVEAGRMDIQLEEISVHEIPHVLRHVFQLAAEEKGLHFEIQVEENVPDLIRTDGRRVNQILQNLLANALKFTRTGTVTLHVGTTRTGTDGTPGEWIAFTVSDTGIGIAEDKQRLIFEAFRQADGSISRRYGGTGLGLSISLELARLLGGGLQVWSREGRGSRFTLILPLSADETQH